MKSVFYANAKRYDLAEGDTLIAIKRINLQKHVGGINPLRVIVGGWLNYQNRVFHFASRLTYLRKLQ